MLHQVNVHQENQTALKFLWWQNGETHKPVKSYQLKVHTFSLTMLSSLAGFALRRTAHQNIPNASELALKTIQTNFSRSVQKVRKLFELRSSHLFQVHSLGVARFTEIK